MKLQYNNLNTLSLSKIEASIDTSTSGIESLIYNFDPYFADYEIATNTQIKGTTYDGYSFNIKGNHFIDDASFITISLFELSNSNVNLKFAGNISYNYDTEVYSGKFTSIQYVSLSANQRFELTGSFGIDPVTAEPTGGTVSYIKVINDGYTISLKGNVTLDADFNLTTGTVTSLFISDDTGNLINVEQTSLNAVMIDRLMDSSSHDDLEDFLSYINQNLSGNDNIQAGSGDDTLFGGAGNDTLDGGSGIDTMAGGKGNDTYLVDNIEDSITELANEGTDLVKASVSYSLENIANVENLILTDGTTNGGIAALEGIGNSLKNTITGNAGNNTLDGLDGVDTLIGGAGDDTYQIDLIETGTSAATKKVALEDVITEAANAGNDTVKLVGDFNHLNATTLTLAANLEHLDVSLTGNTKLHLTGNSSLNILTGNDAANILDGAAGQDTLKGGEGDDTYLLDLKTVTASGVTTLAAFDDTVIETNGSGADTIKLRGTATLTNFKTFDLNTEFANIENIDASATGSSKFNFLGNNANNTFIGNAAANTLNGGDGDDVLDGGTGIDTMTGGTGDDTFVVDVAGDVINEGFDEGIDLVKAAISYTLTDEDLEHLTLTGTGNTNATGNAANNLLTGNTGNNILDGQGGFDTMVGGKGNDTYVVNFASENVIELSNEGTDLVRASVSFSLEDAANVENLTLTDGTTNGGIAALEGIGNSLKNTITGNAGNNTLDGLDGVDTLIGGAGDDTYQIDLIETGTSAATKKVALEDVITEAANAGNDTVKLVGDFNHLNATTLTLAANLEHLDVSLTGNTKLHLTGNSSLNILTGNDAANILDGAAGQDTLKGGEGDDTYLLDLKTVTASGVTTLAAFDDTVIETNGSGADTIKLRGTATLTNFKTFDLNTEFANIENIDASATGSSKFNFLGNNANNTFIGNAAANTLNGGDGDDVLDGGTGIDTMTGGTGDDTFVVDVAGDVINEGFDEGIDLVKAAISYTLTDEDLEHLTLTGTGNTNATGNAANNLLTGNTGNNILDGQGGFDTMVGGKGNDTYVVNFASENVIELSNEGTDLIKASVSIDTLAQNVENLTLTDGSANGGTAGLSGFGNALKNTITGNAGANTLYGRGGVDTLIGGDGADLYLVDLVESGTTAASKKLALEDTVTETATGGIDTLRLLGGAVHQNASTLKLAANIEHLDASGALGKLNLTGNTVNNQLTGNDVANTLDGAAGNDTLIGGDGADRLIGGSGADVFFYDDVTDSTTLAMDTIADFVKGTDKIDLTSLASLSFNDSTAAANSIWFTQSGGITTVFVDTSGDTNADMQIQLTGTINLQATDFMLA